MARLPIPDRRYTDENLRDWSNGLAKRVVSGSFDWTPGLIGANSEVTTTLTTSTTDQVTGLRAGMAASINPPATIDAGLIWGCFVPDSDQLAVRVQNNTGGGITPASGTWTFFAYQT